MANPGFDVVFVGEVNQSIIRPKNASSLDLHVLCDSRFGCDNLKLTHPTGK